MKVFLVKRHHTLARMYYHLLLNESDIDLTNAVFPNPADTFQSRGIKDGDHIFITSQQPRQLNFDAAALAHDDM